MQDIHTIGVGGGGRLFGGSGGGGDRRLRPHHHQQAAIKCPRCDSLNTKFCYYNNYNLSQPRHFCKNCRRYWTKGGVLRNVPVGGGSRKAKRAKSKSATAVEEAADHGGPLPKAISQSSSESSSLTGSAPEVVSVANSDSAPPRIFDFSQPSDISGIFSGTFTNMMTSPSDPVPLMGFNFGATGIMQMQSDGKVIVQEQQRMGTDGEKELGENDLKVMEFVDPTAQIESSGNDLGGICTLDWQGKGDDQELFDLTGAVDQTYWSHHPWPSDDNDHTLYLP